MIQWINVHQNNRFVITRRYPSWLEKTGPILPPLVGLTAGCKAGRLSDEIQVDSRRFEKSLQVKLMKIFTLLTSVQCYYSVRNAFRRLF